MTFGYVVGTLARIVVAPVSRSHDTSAPASSANLGPGFDCLALALELRCVGRAEPSEGWRIHELGETYTPSDGDLVVRAMRAAVGDRPVRLTIENAIPRSRGLGSSAAVVVAAAAAALRAHGEEPTDDQLFHIVNELEGHPDNAAATVFGGLIVAKDDVVRSLDIHSSLRIVAGIPDAHLSTHMARAALPGAIRHAAAARNVARSLLLVEGLRTGDPDTLRAASGDELHELPRRELSPVTQELMEAASGAGALHAAWSGAGPTALAFATETTVTEVERAMGKVLDGAGEVRVLQVAAEGWR